MNRGRRYSLRTRLVVSAVALIAVVAAVIGTVTTIAFRTYLYGQLDSQLSAVAMRAVGPPVAGDAGVPMEMRSKGPLDFVIGGGTPMGTVGALLDDGGAVAKAFRSAEPGTAEGLGPQQSPLTEVQAKALAAVPRDGEAHTVELPDLGHYRVEYETGGQGSFLVGIPTRDVQAALSTLVVVEVCVAGGLVVRPAGAEHGLSAVAALGGADRRSGGCGGPAARRPGGAATGPACSRLGTGGLTGGAARVLPHHGERGAYGLDRDGGARGGGRTGRAQRR